MQNTESAGQPGSAQTVPALPNFLDAENNLAVPQGGTDEDHTTAGSKDVSKEFMNTAAGGGGPASPPLLHRESCFVDDDDVSSAGLSPKEMDGPVKTINSVNPK
jgi:hypothetical protein